MLRYSSKKQLFGPLAYTKSFWQLFQHDFFTLLINAHFLIDFFLEKFAGNKEAFISISYW